MPSAQLSLDDAANLYEFDTASARGVLALFKEAQRGNYGFMEDAEGENPELIFMTLVDALETMEAKGKRLQEEVRGFLEAQATTKDGG